MAVVVVFAMFFALSGLVYAAEKKEKKPDATLTLKEGQVAVGIGWSWGKGDLSYKGKKYAFKVEGLSVGDVGITEAKADGKVYNLKNLEDFSGTYAAATAEGTVGLGAGATASEERKGCGDPSYPQDQGD